MPATRQTKRRQYNGGAEWNAAGQRIGEGNNGWMRRTFLKLSTFASVQQGRLTYTMVKLATPLGCHHKKPPAKDIWRAAPLRGQYLHQLIIVIVAGGPGFSVDLHVAEVERKPGRLVLLRHFGQLLFVNEVLNSEDGAKITS